MQNTTFNWLEYPASTRAQACAIQFQMSQTQKWPQEKLEAAQLFKLAHLLEHSRKTVPFYRKHKYPAISSWQDWRKLPVLTREQIQTHSKYLQCEKDLSASEGPSYKMKTSGSTGRPIEAITSEKAQWFWRATTLRDHLWHERDFSQKLAVIKHMAIDKGRLPGIASKIWGQATATVFDTGPSVMLNSSESIDTQFKWLHKQKAGYLLTYPSILKALAQKNITENKKLQFKHISTLGEAHSQGLRELCKQAFGCKITDMYSAQELGYIALQCPKHNHYHCLNDTVLVEILDDNNQPCHPGELGKVVVTPFHNYLMPLIRYEIGDYAIAGAPCDCGITLPVISKIVGRTRNLVCYPDGSKNWPSYNPPKLMEYLPNAQFQLIQLSPQNMKLKVANPFDISPDIQNKLINVINKAMAFNFNIEIEQVDTIPRSKSGKYEEFVCEIQNNV